MSSASNPAYNRFKSSFLKSPCVRCRLCESRTNIVFDRGNPAAKLLIVGEAPGASEDKAGLSFVGRSGKLLDRLFSSIGIDTNENALVANVVKCRPPKNRPPREDEVRACFDFLDTQIRLVRPELIVLLGATALKRLFPDTTSAMAEEVGKFRVYDRGGVKTPCVTLFHPAYLLYDPRKREAMQGHLETVASFLRGDSISGKLKAS